MNHLDTSATAERHPFFDERGSYFDFRAEFIPGEKLYGLYLALRIERDWEQEQQNRAVTPSSLAEGGDKRNETTASRSNSTAELAARTGDLAAHSGPKVLTIALSNALPNWVEPLYDYGPQMSDTQAEKFEVSVHGLLKYRRRQARAIVLENEVLDHMRSVSPTEEHGLEAQLLEAINGDRIRQNRELARIWASVPDLDGVIDESGSWSQTAGLPAGAPPLSKDAWILLLVDGAN